MHHFHMIFELLTDFVDFDNFVILVFVYVPPGISGCSKKAVSQALDIPTCRLLIAGTVV